MVHGGSDRQSELSRVAARNGWGKSPLRNPCGLRGLSLHSTAALRASVAGDAQPPQEQNSLVKPLLDQAHMWD